MIVLSEYFDLRDFKVPKLVSLYANLTTRIIHFRVFNQCKVEGFMGSFCVTSQEVIFEK